MTASPVIGNPTDYEVLPHGVIHEAFVDPASEATKPRLAPHQPPAAQAAEQDDDAAQFNLGMMYCIGREVPQDMISAHKFFNLATIRGNETAQEYRREIAAEMSAQEIAEAQRQARNWLAAN